MGRLQQIHILFIYSVNFLFIFATQNKTKINCCMYVHMKQKPESQYRMLRDYRPFWDV